MNSQHQDHFKAPFKVFLDHSAALGLRKGGIQNFDQLCSRFLGGGVVNLCSTGCIEVGHRSFAGTLVTCINRDGNCSLNYYHCLKQLFGNSNPRLYILVSTPEVVATYDEWENVPILLVDEYGVITQHPPTPAQLRCGVDSRSHAERSQMKSDSKQNRK